jgi:hypothetical protein
MITTGQCADQCQRGCGCNKPYDATERAHGELVLKGDRSREEGVSDIAATHVPHPESVVRNPESTAGISGTFGAALYVRRRPSVSNTCDGQPRVAWRADHESSDSRDHDGPL